MAPSHLPMDPFAAHAEVMKRAEQVNDRRAEERRKPLPEKSEVQVRFARRQGGESIAAEVLEMSTGGMRIAAFASAQIEVGDRCTITNTGDPNGAPRQATVRWVKPHPMIQVFGVQFDGPQAS